MSYLQKLQHCARLMRWHQPVGIFLLLWPTLWALWLASGGMPKANMLYIFVSGVFLMRSAGCVINDIADRDFDGKVVRTTKRPLAAGVLSVAWAAYLLLFLVSLAGLLLWPLNGLARCLALPAVLLAGVYPFAKRYVACPQWVLGVAFAWSVPMAFAAVQSAVPGLAWYLFIAVVLWVFVYDTFYAMADRDEDRQLPIASSALWLGRHDRWVLAVLQGVLLGLFCGLGFWVGYGVRYGVAILGVAIIMVYQQWLIRQRDPERCLRAFKSNNILGCIVLLGLGGG